MRTWRNEPLEKREPEDIDDIRVSYFVLCDQIITEAGTSKQSLIGIYSALRPPELPVQFNFMVALCVRVRSTRFRELICKIVGPDGQMLFESPNLPCDWNSIEEGLRASGFATLQIGLNLQGIPIQQAGLHEVVLYSDGELLSTYPLSVMPQ